MCGRSVTGTEFVDASVRLYCYVAEHCVEGRIEVVVARTKERFVRSFQELPSVGIPLLTE